MILGCMATSCGMMSTVTRESQYAKMYEEKPITLLVMPPINNSTNVEAKDLLYTSISRPLAEAGYYVISPLLAMDILKAESAYDSEMFFDAPLTSFQNYFGADAVVFSVIDTWAKKGMASRQRSDMSSNPHTPTRYSSTEAATCFLTFQSIQAPAACWEHWSTLQHLQSTLLPQTI